MGGGGTLALVKKTLHREVRLGVCGSSLHCGHCATH